MKNLLRPFSILVSTIQKQASEDVYSAMGRTDAGRYLIIFFIYKKNKDAIILSARQMTSKEKKRYGKK